MRFQGDAQIAADLARVDELQRKVLREMFEARQLRKWSCFVAEQDRREIDDDVIDEMFGKKRTGQPRPAFEQDLVDAAVRQRRQRCRQANAAVVTAVDFDRFNAIRLRRRRSEEHTSELQSLMRISYAVFCLKKKKKSKK